MNISSHRQLGPRLRADLEWTLHADQSRWVARDPLTANFYSFSQLERRTVELMTGGLSVTDIIEQIRRAFPALAIDQPWLGSLLARLQQHHLLVPTSRTDVARLARLRSGSRQRGWLQQLLSPLAIRVPLFNPSRLLNGLRPCAVVLFHPAVVVLWLIAGCGLGLLVMRELLSSNWAQALDVTAIRGDRWLLLFGCYLIAKSLHELGHGLACARTKAECNEIGLMLLCLAPCLYCDTSDSWKLASKWTRAGIAAAGMYVEWILATLAAAVWLMTQDGTLHYVAASLMVVCSVGTLLINSNPLLKYDGYYILSDVWGVPNLSDQGREALRALGTAALAGRPIAKSHFDAPVGWLALYALVATTYRLFILAAIVWICWSALIPLGLGLVAVLLTGMLLGGVVWGQVRALRLFFREVVAAGGFKMVRWTLFCTLLLLGIAAVIEFPLPSVIRARGVSDFEDKQPLFASQTAELIAAAPTGRQLAQGTPLVEFESPESQLELTELRGQVAVLDEGLRQLHLRRAIDPATVYEIPARTEELKELQLRAQVLTREMDKLKHLAPYAGYLIAGPQAVSPPLTAPREDRFGHHPLDPSSLGATCDRSTLIGWFTKKEALILTVIVPEQDVKRLQVGLTADIQWDSDMGQTGSGRITRIASDPIRETPTELIGDPTLLSARNEQGLFLPEKPHYEVTLHVDHAKPRLLGAPATVQFDMPPQTLWERCVELIRQNLKPL